MNEEHNLAQDITDTADSLFSHAKNRLPAGYGSHDAQLIAHTIALSFMASARIIAAAIHRASNGRAHITDR